MEESCSICLESIEEPNSYRLNCKHLFHTSCIKEWLVRKPTCPNCRTLIEPDTRYVEDGVIREQQRQILELLKMPLISLSNAIEQSYSVSLRGSTSTLQTFLNHPDVERMLIDVYNSNELNIFEKSSTVLYILILNFFAHFIVNRSHDTK